MARSSPVRHYLLLLLLSLCLAGCARLPQSGTPESTGADAAFAQLSDRYLASYLAWRPQIGTALGLHLYDGKVTDFSRDSIAAELARLKDYETKLAALSPASLSPQLADDYLILRGAIRREIFGFEKMRVYTSNPMTYAGALDLNIYIKRNFAPLERRVRSIISILDQVPNLTAAAQANLDVSLPRPQVEIAIEQAEGTVDFLEHDLPAAVQPVAKANLLAEFASANQRALSEMRRFAGWLKEEKLPKANDQYSLGRENYEELLACGEGLSLPPETLLEIGLRELRRQQQAFAEAARVIDPARPPIEVFKAIQKDHPSARDLVPATRKDLEVIRQFVVDHKLVTLPSNVRAQVQETPKYLRATGFGSMDTPGPFETKATEAYYYVSPPDADWPPQQVDQWLTAYNYYTTDIMSIHEAYPGHYVQYLCLNASRATRLEKIFVSYAFSEGWAHYAEQMMLDEGFGAGNSPSPTRDEQVRAAKCRLAQADEALLRVCRLCVSIKMHCQGMTIDEATRFFQENCYYEPKSARQEALRGAYDPEYLYYTLGKLEILKLRTDYRKQEGPGFSLQRFHDELLRHGAAPIRLLRQRLLKDPAAWNDVL